MPILAAEADTVSRGETIARQGNGQGASACTTCHGQEGEGNAAAGFPRLAGKAAPYLEKQLHDFQSGARQNPIMQPFANAMTDEEMATVAAYYASLNKPELPTTYQASNPDNAAEWLAKRGDWDNTIPACNQCHGPNGQGVGANFPTLAGQHASYLVAQLNAWRNGSRDNDPNGLMKGIAERLSDEQISMIADYYATLPEHLDSSSSVTAEKEDHQ